MRLDVKLSPADSFVHCVLFGSQDKAEEFIGARNIVHAPSGFGLGEQVARGCKQLGVASLCWFTPPLVQMLIAGLKLCGSACVIVDFKRGCCARWQREGDNT